MTKGQFALLTAALGLVTMGGAGYFAYASSSGHSSGTGSASANGQSTSGSGGGVVPPSGGSTPTGGSGDLGTQTGGNSACRDGQVQVTDQAGQGAAGTVSLVLVFQNVGSSTCTLHGFPGASLVAKDGKDLLNATRQLPDGLAKSPVVVLAPGEQATASLLWNDVDSGSGCAVRYPVTLLVTPPNTRQSTPLTMSSGAQVCSEFRIHPVLTGVTPG